jgi:hypothetical protein
MKSVPLNLIAAVLALSLALPTLLGAAAASEWTPEIEKVDAILRKGKWKQGHRLAKKTTQELIRRSWYGAGLRESLTDLAVLLAVAEANLGRREDAIWHWHMAQNLDSRVRKRDLTPYGDAAKLLYEFPLRGSGEVPAPFKVRETTVYSKVEKPKSDRPPQKTILNNTAAVRERPGNFHAEIIVDRQGKTHQPVVTSGHLHPIVLFATLEWLREIPPFKPARVDGEVTDFVMRVTVRFDFSRW